MSAAFVINAHVADPNAATFAFAAQKTMYGGKRIAPGDVLYVFDSENEGGAGLVARALVEAAILLPPAPDLARQTPRVSITAQRNGSTRRSLGRAELRRLNEAGGPAAELHFKFYRQATNKIGGVSPEAAAFLDAYF